MQAIQIVDVPLPLLDVLVAAVELLLLLLLLLIGGDAPAGHLSILVDLLQELPKVTTRIVLRSHPMLLDGLGIDSVSGGAFLDP